MTPAAAFQAYSPDHHAPIPSYTRSDARPGRLAAGDSTGSGGHRLGAWGSLRGWSGTGWPRWWTARLAIRFTASWNAGAREAGHPGAGGRPNRQFPLGQGTLSLLHADPSAPPTSPHSARPLTAVQAMKGQVLATPGRRGGRSRVERQEDVGSGHGIVPSVAINAERPRTDQQAAGGGRQ